MRFSTAATTFLALSSPASAQLSVLTGVVTILNDFNKLVNDTITFNIFVCPDSFEDEKCYN